MQNKQQKVECSLPLSWFSLKVPVQLSGRMLSRTVLGFAMAGCGSVQGLGVQESAMRMTA